MAARGLDIQGITHVVHYDFPKDFNQYVHRSGRTGRFGASGTVISLVTEREERELKKYARELERFCRSEKISWRKYREFRLLIIRIFNLNKEGKTSYTTTIR